MNIQIPWFLCAVATRIVTENALYRTSQKGNIYLCCDFVLWKLKSGKRTSFVLGPIFPNSFMGDISSIITALVRSTTGRYCFHRCLSVHTRRGSTPSPSHNTSTGPMSFPGGGGTPVTGPRPPPPRPEMRSPPPKAGMG